MNPYEPPRSQLRHFSRPPTFHGNLAAVLMFLALLLRFGSGAAVSYMSFLRTGAGYLLLEAVYRGLWLWASFHLTRYLRISAWWTLAGILSCIGLPVIFLAAREKRTWDRTAHLRPQQPRVRRGDPNSPW